MSIFNNPRNVTFTIGGEKFKGVLTKGLEMANEEKYIPKVGDTVLSDSGNECIVLHVGEKSLFVKWSDGEEFSADFDYFRPMPKKADIERKILLDILNKEESFKFSVASEIQKAGFTIPKRFTKEDITTAIYGRNSGMDNAVCVAHVCELLGDLVED